MGESDSSTCPSAFSNSLVRLLCFSTSRIRSELSSTIYCHRIMENDSTIGEQTKVPDLVPDFVTMITRRRPSAFSLDPLEVEWDSSGKLKVKGEENFTMYLNDGSISTRRGDEVRPIPMNDDDDIDTLVEDSLEQEDTMLQPMTDQERGIQSGLINQAKESQIYFKQDGSEVVLKSAMRYAPKPENVHKKSVARSAKRRHPTTSDAIREFIAELPSEGEDADTERVEPLSDLQSAFEQAGQALQNQSQEYTEVYDVLEAWKTIGEDAISKRSMSAQSMQTMLEATSRAIEMVEAAKEIRPMSTYLRALGSYKIDAIEAKPASRSHAELEKVAKKFSAATFTKELGESFQECIKGRLQMAVAAKARQTEARDEADENSHPSVIAARWAMLQRSVEIAESIKEVKQKTKGG